MSPAIAALRPRHWIKNAFVLPALIFSKQATEWPYVQGSLGAFLSFCLLSSVVYLINDLCDRERDRLHPEKSKRPIASGELAAAPAVLIAVMLLAAGLVIAYLLNPQFAAIAGLYWLLNLAYSLRLKQIVLLDVIVVAFGYLLRALGGAVAIAVEISTWFILCSFMLALFLTVVKRRQEIVDLREGAGEHRASLDAYSLPFLDQVISVLTSATLVCYALYAMGVGDGAASSRHMQWTIPFVLYGILRYLYVVYKMGVGANPTAVAWTDRPLQINLGLWLVVSALGLYGLPG